MSFSFWFEQISHQYFFKNKKLHHTGWNIVSREDSMNYDQIKEQCVVFAHHLWHLIWMFDMYCWFQFHHLLQLHHIDSPFGYPHVLSVAETLRIQLGFISCLLQLQNEFFPWWMRWVFQPNFMQNSAGMLGYLVEPSAIKPTYTAIYHWIGFGKWTRNKIPSIEHIGLCLTEWSTIILNWMIDYQTTFCQNMHF